MINLHEEVVVYWAKQSTVYSGNELSQFSFPPKKRKTTLESKSLHFGSLEASVYTASPSSPRNIFAPAILPASTASPRSFVISWTLNPPLYPLLDGAAGTTPGTGHHLSQIVDCAVDAAKILARTLGSMPDLIPMFIASAVARAIKEEQ